MGPGAEGHLLDIKCPSKRLMSWGLAGGTILGSSGNFKR
jgi:hypothetical protein